MYDVRISTLQDIKRKNLLHTLQLSQISFLLLLYKCSALEFFPGAVHDTASLFQRLTRDRKEKNDIFGENECTLTFSTR